MIFLLLKKLFPSQQIKNLLLISENSFFLRLVSVAV